MRREIINSLRGPNGKYIEHFGPATIDDLVKIGLIKYIGSSEVKYPEEDLVIEVRAYRKA